MQKKLLSLLVCAGLASMAQAAVTDQMIENDAKSTGDNEITLRRQIEGEARHCSLKITFGAEGAKVEQSPECGYFVGGICHFDSEGKELIRVK